MATNSVQGKWNHTEEEEDDDDEEEEEEALSLSDLPVINHDHHQPGNKDQNFDNKVNEEFDFRSWGGFFSKEPEMCAADEVFFEGQILPLRLSFSSEAGLLTTPSQSLSQHYGKQLIINRSKSSSDSFDHCSTIEFQSSSNSSRSSSLRSQNSSSSTSSATTIRPPRTKPKIRNQFHTHPSPKPQLRASGPRQLTSFGNQGRKSSSAWEIFRLGVVPAPEIGLQDLKVRSSNVNKNCVSRNSSSSSNNSVSNGAAKSVKMSSKKSNNVLKQFVSKSGGLLSGCDCSFETVQSNMVMIKGGSGTKSRNKTESTTTHAAKEKVVVELKKPKHRQKQGKKVMSRRRTFEWLKELHATHPDEEALLSNP
ncbi:hypothetical protein RJT34_30813 [Clitoria ternatea]|uniref:Uncharacterized protein n=1 Tax=Clitoria ternatea TaxID=43366 RepID=A0AAN9ETU5_CLITE